VTLGRLTVSLNAEYTVLEKCSKEWHEENSTEQEPGNIIQQVHWGMKRPFRNDARHFIGGNVFCGFQSSGMCHLASGCFILLLGLLNLEAECTKILHNSLTQ
jgi:hypothetical protein